MSGSTGIYQIEWPDLDIHAHVNRIKESTDHEVKAEVTITSDRSISSGHLRNGRVNLTSPSSRNTFAKSLSARVSEIDWDTVMEQLCMAVLSDWRKCTAMVELDRVEVKAQSKWLIKPLINLNHPTIVYGPGSTGKSWFAQYIAVLADEGLSHGGFEVEPCVGRVLYLDWETAQLEIGSRITMIREGLGLEGRSRIKYRPMTQGLANDIERIRELVDQNDFQLLIVDSVASACAGEPESADVVGKMFNALRGIANDYNVSSLLIDHTNKEGHLFGSVYKYNYGRQVFEAKKEQQANEPNLTLVLHHKKANNSMSIRPMGFSLEFTEDTIKINQRDVRGTALGTALDQIADALRRGPLSITELSDILGMSESHIRKEVSIGKNQKALFIKLADGRYANRSFLEDAQEVASFNTTV